MNVYCLRMRIEYENDLKRELRVYLLSKAVQGRQNQKLFSVGNVMIPPASNQMFQKFWHITLIPRFLYKKRFEIKSREFWDIFEPNVGEFF